jgi:putative transposase
LAYVTPEQRHTGTTNTILERRRDVYAAAQQRHPLRWKRHTRPWLAPNKVWLNPPSKLEQRMAA